MKLPKTRPTPLAVSIALHLVIGTALVRVLVFGYDLPFLERDERVEAREETVTFVTPRTAPGDPDAAPDARGGGGARNPAPAPRLVAPTTVPDGVAPATPSAERAASGVPGGTGEGPLGPATGLRPHYGDARVWAPPEPWVDRMPTAKERVDSVIADRFRSYADSAERARLAEGRQPGDWTIKDGKGRAWGMDRQAIRLGPVSIPNAVLGLLPLNRNVNIVKAYEDRRLAEMSQDIRRSVDRGEREDEFKDAVKRIRERKERERIEERRRREGQAETVAPASP